MIKEWFNWINLSAAIAAVALFATAALVWFWKPEPISVLDVPATKSMRSEYPFEQTKEAYDAIGETLFDLKSAPITVQLPDLRTTLNYYGKNTRPDADPASALMYFNFNGEKSITSVVPNEKTYLVFDRRSTPPRYNFSPNNAETHLWFEASIQGTQAIAKVRLKDENGNIISEPPQYAQFPLVEKPTVNLGYLNNWEIGNLRVDGTLLARQKARWYGIDNFLEQHGGKEYEHTLGKHRIDFGEGEDAYSVFITKDTSLTWTGTQWKPVNPGEETLGKPILFVKKIDDKLMNLELWDPEGKSKVALNLLRSNEAVMPPNLLSNFKFLGAKTLSQFVFEINKERVILSPQDWLLQVDKGWKKLTTPEDIDNYVERKSTGYLFVFDAIEKHDDRQVLVGTLFNRGRTDFQHIEMPLQQAGGTATPMTPQQMMEKRKASEAAAKQADKFKIPPMPNANLEEDDDEDEDSSLGETGE